MKKKYCSAIVLAAGKGSRMGTETAKQYLELGGRPMVVYGLEAFQNSPLIDEIIFITDKEHLEYCKREIVQAYGLFKVSYVGVGGSERYESVWKALGVLTGFGGWEPEKVWESRQNGYVFIHDGARPFATPEMIGRAYEAVCRWGACAVGMPVKDTIKLVDENGCVVSCPKRSLVWQAQTPQAFSVPLIVNDYEKQIQKDCSLITDDAMVVEAQTGIKVHMVRGSYENIKITTPEDLAVAEALLQNRKRDCKNLEQEKPG